MQRILEPELMESEEQSLAYAEADFTASNTQFIELLFSIFGRENVRGRILDLGCGDADILFCLARQCSDCDIEGIDGSEAMLRHATARLEREPELKRHLHFARVVLPNFDSPAQTYDVVLSNSLLHHLHRPAILWETIRRCARSGAAVLVMDLFRPESTVRAGEIVTKYAAGAPEVLRRDFYNSLLAAFRVEEVREQLSRAGLHQFQVRQSSDRHLIAFGNIA